MTTEVMWLGEHYLGEPGKAPQEGNTQVSPEGVRVS